MADTSRRAFLRNAGITAAAAAAVTAAGPATGALAKGTDADGADLPDASTERLVAYVKDARSGQISVMSGDHETTVVDRALAQRLARLAD